MRKIKGGARQRLGTWDRIYSFFRCLLNPLSVYHKLFLPNFLHYQQPKYLNNLFNPNMNNVVSIDYANYDQTRDNDGVLSRWTTEFPRLSHHYVSKAHANKAPWGTKSRPVRFDCWQETTLAVQHSCERETTLGGQTFEPGIWYYSGIEMIDHHDLSGLVNQWRQVETMLGRETRPQFYINTLNRLRMLDFTEQSSDEPTAAGIQLSNTLGDTCLKCS